MRRWEKNFNHQDVDAIITYRKEKLPLVEERANSLHVLTARTLKAGLVACGWTSEALLKPTRLTLEIKKHQLESNPPNNETEIDSSNWSSYKRGRNDIEATFDELGQSHTTETPEAVTPDDASTSNAMRPIENTGIDAWSTDHLRHSFHLPSIPPRPDGSSEAQPVTINFNSAERLQVLSASGSGQGVADSMDKNMLDSLGRACYLPHALESDPSLERTINPHLLSMDTNMLSSLDNACFLSDALDAGMLSTLDKACFLSDALESDLNTERSQPQFQHAEDENMVWDQNDTNTDLGIVV